MTRAKWVTAFLTSRLVLGKRIKEMHEHDRAAMRRLAPEAPPHQARMQGAVVSRLKNLTPAFPSTWRERGRSEFAPDEDQYSDLLFNLVRCEERLEAAEQDRDAMIEAYLDEREARQEAVSTLIAFSSEDVVNKHMSKADDEYPQYDVDPVVWNG